MGGCNFTDGWSTDRYWVGEPGNRIPCTAFYDPAGRLVDVVLGYGEFDAGDDAAHTLMLQGHPNGGDISHGDWLADFFATA